MRKSSTFSKARQLSQEEQFLVSAYTSVALFLYVFKQEHVKRKTNPNFKFILKDESHLYEILEDEYKFIISNVEEFFSGKTVIFSAKAFWMKTHLKAELEMLEIHSEIEELLLLNETTKSKNWVKKISYGENASKLKAVLSSVCFLLNWERYREIFSLLDPYSLSLFEDKRLFGGKYELLQTTKVSKKAFLADKQIVGILQFQQVPQAPFPSFPLPPTKKPAPEKPPKPVVVKVQEAEEIPVTPVPCGENEFQQVLQKAHDRFFAKSCTTLQIQYLQHIFQKIYPDIGDHVKIKAMVFSGEIPLKEFEEKLFKHLKELERQTRR